jgi:hypothetical protein
LYRSLKREIKNQKPDFILYPVPPWYIMIMAPIIKRKTKLPYAIDFIDPWVHDIKKKNFKARVSQWIARRFEGLAVRKADVIFAVSRGMLDALLERNPSLKNIPMIEVPYGVEASDYLAIKSVTANRDPFVIRYTGAISEPMLPVVCALIKALAIVQKEIPIRVEFTGTSYAGEGLVKPVLNGIIEQNKADSFIKEFPARVGYRQALELGNTAGMQLVIGAIIPYYTASKLMGLAASGKPFYAIVNKDSFPAFFLSEIGFENKFDFDPEEIDKTETVSRLAVALRKSILGINFFKPIPLDNPVLNDHTAFAMTKKFSDAMKEVIK